MHYQFRCVELRRAVAQGRTELSDLLSLTVDQLTSAQHLFGQLDRCQHLVELSARRTTAKIEQRYDEIVQLLTQTKLQQLNAVKDFTTEETERICGQKMRMQVKVERLQRAMHSVEEISDNGSDMEILRERNELASLLAENDSIENCLSEFSEIRFKSKQSHLKTVEQIFGHVEQQHRPMPSRCQRRATSATSGCGICRSDVAVYTPTSNKYVPSSVSLSGWHIDHRTQFECASMPSSVVSNIKTESVTRAMNHESDLAIDDEAPSSDLLHRSKPSTKSSDSSRLSSDNSPRDNPHSLSVPFADDVNDERLQVRAKSKCAVISNERCDARAAGVDSSSLNNATSDEDRVNYEMHLSRVGVVFYHMQPIIGIPDVVVFSEFCRHTIGFVPDVEKSQCRRLASKTYILSVRTLPLLIVFADQSEADRVVAGFRRLLKKSPSYLGVGMSRYHAQATMDAQSSLTPCNRRCPAEDRKCSSGNSE